MPPLPALARNVCAVLSAVASIAAWVQDTTSTVAAMVGAFSWIDPFSSDSAILITLPPCSHTAQASGKSGDTGIALFGVYAVPV